MRSQLKSPWLLLNHHVRSFILTQSPSFCWLDLAKSPFRLIKSNSISIFVGSTWLGQPWLRFEATLGNPSSWALAGNWVAHPVLQKHSPHPGTKTESCHDEMGTTFSPQKHLGETPGFWFKNINLRMFGRKVGMLLGYVIGISLLVGGLNPSEKY